MKISSLPLVLLAMASSTMANTPPAVVIQSAVMRPGTTLMDVVYRVNDPDNATVKTRAHLVKGNFAAHQVVGIEVAHTGRNSTEPRQRLFPFA